MSRDSKARKSQPSRKKSGGGTLLGMFIGLVLGVALAAGVVWMLNKSPLPFNKQVLNEVSNASGGTADKPAKPAAGEPMLLPGKPGDPVPEKRFQFYDILPGKADAVPDKAEKAAAVDKEAAKNAAGKDAGKDLAAKEKEAKEARELAERDAKLREEAAKESRTPMFLQVGSYSSAQDADNQKAKLAFMGMEAVVQQVMIQDKTLFRVRVGPYTRHDELNKVRADLAKSGIEAQLAK